MPYDTHFPEAYDKFKSHNDLPSKFRNKLSETELHTANAYDNSILYTDYILSHCIKLLRESEGMAFLLYFSDHGEEVFDSQQLSGRSFDNLTESLCRIPFFVWQNETYQKSNKLFIDLERPYSTDDVIHSMMDLIGVSYDKKDTCRSIFSPEFQPKVRKVNDKNFDEEVK